MKKVELKLTSTLTSVLFDELRCHEDQLAIELLKILHGRIVDDVVSSVILYVRSRLRSQGSRCHHDGSDRVLPVLSHTSSYVHSRFLGSVVVIRVEAVEVVVVLYSSKINEVVLFDLRKIVVRDLASAFKKSFPRNVYGSMAQY